MKKTFKDILIGSIGIIVTIYIILPSPLPDFIPFIGALDEVTAGLILINCLKYFGIDLTRFFKR
jgi:uncharacterized membrane protein YkvA (DUF1232 family)